jgi:signal transduction histidine kinase
METSKRVTRMAVGEAGAHDPQPEAATGRGEAELDALLETVALISHDLRGPLETIVFSTTVLKRSLEQHRLLDELSTIHRIAANAERMNSMIGELLEAARPDPSAARLQRVACDLADIVVNVVERLDDAARVRIDVDATDRPYALMGDPERLERAIANLVTNALKYSPRDERVRVLVTRSDREIAVEVVDRGIGIAEEYLPRLFDRFFRVPTDTRDGGLGLGLYIARLAAEAHGGRIACASEIGRGSSFRVTLPRPEQ